MKRIGIVMLNWNGFEDTIECIESIKESETHGSTIFLLDNNSSDESVINIEKWLNEKYKFRSLSISDDKFNDAEKLEKFELIFIKGKENLGFAKGNNFILNKIKNLYDFSFLLNNDTIVTENAINTMLQVMDENQEIGALSCNIKMHSNPDMLWNAGGDFTWYGDRRYYSEEKIKKCIKNNKLVINTPFITGCALMVRKEVLNSIGVLTEKFFFGEEDFNYCMRLKKNKIQVKTVLNAIIYHKVSSSIKKSYSSTNKSYKNYILHFTNRIINMKSFYTKEYWGIWRVLYLSAISTKILFWTQDLKVTKQIMTKISFYTNNEEEVNYELFKKINELQIG